MSKEDEFQREFYLKSGKKPKKNLKKTYVCLFNCSWNWPTLSILSFIACCSRNFFHVRHVVSSDFDVRMRNSVEVNSTSRGNPGWSFYMEANISRSPGLPYRLDRNISWPPDGSFSCEWSRIWSRRYVWETEISLPTEISRIMWRGPKRPAQDFDQETPPW